MGNKTFMNNFTDMFIELFIYNGIKLIMPHIIMSTRMVLQYGDLQDEEYTICRNVRREYVCC